MGKVKLLLDVIADMRSLADSLQAVADAMTQTDSVDAPVENTGEKPKKTGGKKTAKEAAETTPPPAPEEKPLTLEAVRMVLAEKSRAGHTAEVRALLVKHGAEKLSDIDPARYPALLADAEVL